jgi:hypothetical protein
VENMTRSEVKYFCTELRLKIDKAEAEEQVKKNGVLDNVVYR